LQVSIASLYLHLNLGVDISNHMHLGILSSAVVSQDVYEYTDVRVSAKLGLQKPYETLEVLKFLFRYDILVVNAVGVVLE